jgi:two-component system, OmpR family, KDP operon response regulator KdpE
MSGRVLIIDDEPAITRVLGPVLSAAGWTVFEAPTAVTGIRIAQAQAPDIVLLDLGLPDADGKEIIPLLRRSGRLAVIVISARHQEAEKVAALDAGADDYVDKPFNIDELAARIRAAERRLKPGHSERERYEAGDLLVDLPMREVRLMGEVVKLSPKEFDLLHELVSHAGQVVTHKRLLLAGWGDPNVDPQYLRGYIAMLRQKLEEDPSEPQLIISEPGVGYRLTTNAL